MKIALTVAGSDSGGGAGIQADLKTFQELGVFGASVLTAVTAQNTQGVYAVEGLSAALVEAQLKAVLEDFPVAAVKLGMLFSVPIIEKVAYLLNSSSMPIIADPVMVAKSGAFLLEPLAIKAYGEYLFPLVNLLTPNLPEAEALTQIKIDSEKALINAARKLQGDGVRNVLIKGGHANNPAWISDYLFLPDRCFRINSVRIPTLNTHGTGCTFSSAITAFIAKGHSLLDAVMNAKRFLHLAIKYAVQLGHGWGPVNFSAYRSGEVCEIQVHEF
ncbi:MAG: bifunctional hydroxymethylpyrimidine kinase/phosphomethylpyrimidine kinase [Neisseriaceae bacterium]